MKNNDIKRKPDLIRRRINSKEDIRRPIKYKGELDQSKDKLQESINNIIKNYEDKHNVVVQLHLDPNKELRYYARLIIYLDS